MEKTEQNGCVKQIKEEKIAAVPKAVDPNATGTISLKANATGTTSY